jgi:hypothetical protein
MVRGLRTRHSPFPHVLEHFSFFAIYAFLAAIHSLSCFRCELSVSRRFPPFHHSNIPPFHTLGREVVNGTGMRPLPTFNRQDA